MSGVIIGVHRPSMSSCCHLSRQGLWTRKHASVQCHHRTTGCGEAAEQAAALDATDPGDVWGPHLPLVCVGRRLFIVAEAADNQLQLLFLWRPAGLLQRMKSLHDMPVAPRTTARLRQQLRCILMYRYVHSQELFTPCSGDRSCDAAIRPRAAPCSHHRK